MDKNGKHIGIVACSAEGAALCYRTICVEAAAHYGRHGHPEVSLHTYNLAEYMEAIYQADWKEVGHIMNRTAKKLLSIGAEILVCPDNTIHQSFEVASGGVTVPWLHIADEVMKVAKERGYKKIGLTGTKYLMEGPVYKEFAAQYDIEYLIPDEKDRVVINEIIFDELVNSIFKGASRQTFVEIISKLKDRGCEAVILGCTEIPLLIDDSVSPIPTIDSTRTLARAAIRESLK